jgi:hypothetical protein
MRDGALQWQVQDLTNSKSTPYTAVALANTRSFGNGKDQVAAWERSQAAFAFALTLSVGEMRMSLNVNTSNSNGIPSCIYACIRELNAEFPGEWGAWILTGHGNLDWSPRLMNSRGEARQIDLGPERHDPAHVQYAFRKLRDCFNEGAPNS